MMRLAKILFSCLAAFALLAAPGGRDARGSAETPARRAARSHRSHTCLVLEARNAFSAVSTPSTVRQSPEFEVACAVLRKKALWLPEVEVRALAQKIVSISRSTGIDSDLILAMIQTESNFRPSATSPKGAVGLMQLLPSTARKVAEELRIAWRGDATLHDPHVNLELGAAYLQTLLRRYDGDARLALTAYNMGPSRVDANLDQGLPLPEGYARKVLAHRAHLQSAFPVRDTSSIPR